MKANFCIPVILAMILLCPALVNCQYIVHLPCLNENPGLSNYWPLVYHAQTINGTNRSAIWEPDPDNSCLFSLGYTVDDQGNNPGVSVDVPGAFAFWNTNAANVNIDFTEDYYGYMATRAPSGAKTFGIWIKSSLDWDYPDGQYGFGNQQLYSEGLSWRIYYSTIEVLNDMRDQPPFGVQVVTKHEIGHGLLFEDDGSGDGFYAVPPGATLGPNELGCLNCVYDPVYINSCLHNVANEFTGFWVSESLVATWEAGSGVGVLSYLIEGFDGDQWLVVNETASNEVGDFSVQLFEPKFSRYRLIENSMTNVRVVEYASPGSRESVSSQGGQLDLNVLLSQAKNDFLNSVNYINEQDRLIGKKMLVFGTGGFNQVVSDNCQLLWEESWGCEVQYLNVESFGSDPSSVRNGIKATISNYFDLGYEYFLLVGSANDYIQFQSEMWDSFWWGDIRDAYIGDGYPVGGYPEYDLIPTWYYEDSGQPNLTMSAVSPYWYSDFLYSDIDSNGIPDVSVTRWPAKNEDEVVSFIIKMYKYSILPVYGSAEQSRLVFFVGDENYRLGYNDHALTRETAVEVNGRIPQEVVNWTTFMSEMEDLSKRNMEFASLINSTAPNLAIIYSNGSNEYSVGGFLDSAAWDMELIDDSRISGYIGATCLTSDFARSYSEANGQQTFLKFLFNPIKGAAFWVGPVNATWQPGNTAFLKTLVDNIYLVGDKPISSKFVDAQSSVLTTNHNNKGHVSDVVKSYGYFGCPLSPFRSGGDSPVSVPYYDRPAIDALGVFPNPFNPVTTITFELSAPQGVTLTVFDLQGRPVRTLLSGEVVPQGHHEAQWDGRDGSGRQAASGTYFFKLEAGGRVETKRAILIK